VTVPQETSQLFAAGVHALNIGLASFAEPPRVHGGTVLQLDWRPPAGADREMGLLVARLDDDTAEGAEKGDVIGQRIAAANAAAVGRILAARPVLADVRPAREAIAFLGGSGPALLHSGPPIEWSRMCGPMQGAAIGAVLLEGWASSPEQARALLDAGSVAFEPCHEHGAVGPMAGVVAPSMAVVVVENQDQGNRAFATLNEGLGKVLRFGAYDETVLARLAWMRDVLGPSLGEVVRREGPVDLKSITAQALQMGDEGHNRNAAATSLFARTVAPWLVRHVDRDAAVGVLDFLRANDHFYLNLSMAAAKSSMDAAADVDASTVVTAMARNGVDFGLRLAGTGDRWFTTPVGVPDGLYFPGYGPDDANPDLGDSSITETSGIGGFAMAAAPAIVRFVGGSAEDALGYTREMGRITLARNPAYGIPSLGFEGTPTGIDARRVVETGVAPVINTGIAHREAGIGQIGAGIARAPLPCFAAALVELGRGLGVDGSDWDGPSEGG
jgi:hypothetical protein